MLSVTTLKALTGENIKPKISKVYLLKGKQTTIV